MTSPKLLKEGDLKVYTFETGRWNQNTYVIFKISSSKCILVDPGLDFGKISNFIETELNTTPSKIILTHAHHDHVGALADFVEKYSLKFHLHQKDKKLLRRAPNFALLFEENHIKVPKEGHLPLKEEFDGIKSFIDVTDDIQYLHTPGHTEGSVVFSVGNFLFTGDTLLNRMIGRTDLPGACPSRLGASINHFLNLVKPDNIIMPGHGDPWTVKKAREWWADNSSNTPEYRTE